MAFQVGPDNRSHPDNAALPDIEPFLDDRSTANEGSGTYFNSSIENGTR